MATAAGNTRSFEFLVGDVLRFHAFQDLDRLGGQRMAEFTPRSALVELGVGKMAEVAGRLTNLEVIRIRYMLMAIGTVRFLAFDLIFLAKMRLVNKGHLFGEFYFLSLDKSQNIISKAFVK